MAANLYERFIGCIDETVQALNELPAFSGKHWIDFWPQVLIDEMGDLAQEIGFEHVPLKIIQTKQAGGVMYLVDCTKPRPGTLGFLAQLYGVNGADRSLAEVPFTENHKRKIIAILREWKPFVRAIEVQTKERKAGEIRKDDLVDLAATRLGTRPNELKVLAAHTIDKTVSEIAKAAGVPRSTTHDILRRYERKTKETRSQREKVEG